MEIREYAQEDEGRVIALWTDCDLTRPWNDPAKDIARKVRVDDGMFLVGVDDGQVVATVMLVMTATAGG